NRLDWTLASWPVPVDINDYERGKILWHNPRQQPLVEEVYDRESAQGEGSLTTLRLIFRPKNKKIEGEDTTQVASWGGIMRYFGNRVDADRAQLFEMRAKGYRGKIHFDFGVISEDVDGDGSPNNEDANQNYAVDDSEDLGLDGLTDVQEAEELGIYDNSYDPAGDNYYFFGQGDCPVAPEMCSQMENLNPDNYQNDSIYYEWLNGTQGNSDDIALGNAPDKEVLSSSSFETRNAYFSFVIDLADPVDPFYVIGSERNNWRTFRIPIQDPLMQDEVIETDGVTAKWSQISYIRVWLEADDSAAIYDTLEIADWYFVQSNWNDTIRSDPYYVNESNTDFVVASVSTEDGTFEPPPGVKAYKDEATNVTEPQRGLSLEYDSLHYGDTCLAEKNLVSVESYSGYRTMKMYISGGDADQPYVMFFFRFGEDEENYYEFQKRGLYGGWDERNYMEIDFEELTAVKDEIQRNLPEGMNYADVDTAVGQYRIKGNPRLDEVLYFAAGILNVDEENRNNIYTGKVVLDELRLTDVRDNVGRAGRIAVSGSMADLIRYSFNYQSQDPYFRGISAATRGGSNNNLGSGKTQNSLRYDLTLNVDKFLPKSWNSKIPVSFGKTETSEIPLLRTNSDILLPDDVRESEKSTGDTRSFRFSEAFNKAGRNPLFSVLLNRQKVSFSYSKSEKTSVNKPYSITENYNIKADYDMSIKNVPTLPIFFWTKPLPLLKKTQGSRLSLYPSSWRWSGNYNRNLSISDDINQSRISSFTRDFSGSMDMSYNVFENLKTTFNYTTRRDLTDPDLINIVFNPKDFKLGLETSYSQSFTANYDPKLLNFLSSSFSYSGRYGDTYDRSYKTRKSDLTRTWSVKGSLDHMKLFGGKSSGRSSGPQRARPAVRGGVTTQEVKAGGGKPFYDPILAGFRFLTGWINPINYKYGEGYSNSLPGMTERPSWFYRFGFYDQPDVPVKVETRTPSASENKDYDFSSGFTFLGGITTDVKFTRSIDQDLIKTGTRYKDVTTGWPELSIRIQKFSKFPLIKSLLNKFIDVFSPRTSYSRQLKEEYNLNTGFITNRTETINRNPLLSVNFKLFRSLSLSGSYTTSETNTEKYTPSTGTLDSETRALKKSFAFSTKYSFSSPGGISIPLFGKLRFNSTVQITLDVKFNSNITETNSGKGYVTSTDKSDLTVSPVISYQFSQQIKGGLSARWQDTQDNYSGRKSHVRELQIWTEIRF
ncbi:MAG: cell surface protein SprA, partial [Candidatus Zixiibacteriota bacterium]